LHGPPPSNSQICAISGLTVTAKKDDSAANRRYY
jgi:hypothetical protein